MCPIVIIAFNVLLICFVTIAELRPKEELYNDNKRKCILNSGNKNAYKNLITCQKNYIAYNTNNNVTDASCKTTTDVDKAYTLLRELYFECYNEAEFHAFFNESVILRNDYFKHAFSKEKIKEFYDNDGSQCVNSMRSDIEQCVNKTLNIKKPFIKNITYSLIRITKPLHFNKRTCGNSANIKKCILDIPINDCNATKQFIAYLHDYIANKYCKKDIDKPTASKYSGTGVTIGVLFAVIAILAIAFVIYKRRHNIFRKKGAPKEGQDACSYNVAQETVTT